MGSNVVLACLFEQICRIIWVKSWKTKASLKLSVFNSLFSQSYPDLIFYLLLSLTDWNTTYTVLIVFSIKADCRVLRDLRGIRNGTLTAELF